MLPMRTASVGSPTTAPSREFICRRPPTVVTHIGIGLPWLIATALALQAEVVLSATVLGLVGVMTLEPVYERGWNL